MAKEYFQMLLKRNKDGRVTLETCKCYLVRAFAVRTAEYRSSVRSTSEFKSISAEPG